MRIHTVLLAATFVACSHAERIVRFLSDDGKIYFGDAILPPNTTNAFHSAKARVITGDILKDYRVTQKVKPIKKLLAPLPSEAVRTVRMVGFNYAPHANQSGQPIPEWPILFYKPWTALNTPSDPIPVGKLFQPQDNFISSMDYETELVVVIGKKALNVKEEDALDYVLGYSVGHDVSHRGWQIERGGLPRPQFNVAKGSDGWAPWGPAIVTKNIIRDPNSPGLNLWTKVNGRTVQNATTHDMIFGVRELVSFFSQGVTLYPGDLIFTGTPEGVNLGKPNPTWLVNGDVVEVGLAEVGTCSNQLKYV